MTTIKAEVPDYLHQQVIALAQQENVSIEQLVTMALAAQVSALLTKNYLSQGDWEKFQQVLAKVPDVEPEEYDRL
jgi:hypothetical protein